MDAYVNNEHYVGLPALIMAVRRMSPRGQDSAADRQNWRRQVGAGCHTPADDAESLRMRLADQPSLLQVPQVPLEQELRAFSWNGKRTRLDFTETLLPDARTVRVETFINEFWTRRQRAAHTLHEISYRACFKPQLPRFFIGRLTSPGDRIYDPFMGRGTTPLEAALLGRVPMGCDINPLSGMLLAPRLAPPTLRQVQEALAEVDFADADEHPDELLTFYHPETLREICALRKHLLTRANEGRLTGADGWIRMVAVNRLTGHSPGFFSVYTMPPNQAVSVESQRRINARLSQAPPRRDVPGLILAKSRALLRDCDEATRGVLASAARNGRLLTSRASSTPELESGSIALVVTSPPFLDVVDYAGDNWLRCWFCGIDPSVVGVKALKNLDVWQQLITDVFIELRRVLRPGGHVAFEVGEVRGGALRLEQAVVACAVAAGLEPLLVLINAQRFTKTANCWGVTNNLKGTNSNRVVLLRRP